jgi:hypothetical protein
VVDENGDGERLFGLAFEDGDLLECAVVADFEVGFFERAYEGAVLVFYGGENADEADVDADGRAFLGERGCTEKRRD